ncbi:MAG TPA: hypothetical protein VF525_01345 [Pyrinomonadaceae bacterium]|jgi:hypothetical protein
MNKFLAILTLCAGLLATGVNAQQPAAPTTTPAPQTTTTNGISPNRVSGEVSALDPAAQTITIKADGTHELVAVQTSATTKYYRAKPEALAHADKLTPADLLGINLADISIGDRLVALGKVADDHKSVPARIVIMMTKADHVAKQEKDREQWRRRGILGVVASVNPATKEITINSRGREGVHPVVIAASDTTQFRRYAPDSVKFDDAKPSAFAELKVGDQLRALGERSPDGARFTPEEVVSGSFRTLLGTVTAVNAAGNQITIKDNQTKQPLTVVISQDSSLRRVPEMMAQMAMRGPGGMGGGRPEGQGQGRPAGQQPPAGGAAPQGGGEPGGGSGQRRFGGPGGGGFDVQQMLERLPPTTLADLKAGDVIIVSSTVGADPTRVTAINVIAGADTLIAMLQPRQQQQQQTGGNLGTGLPAGIDFGIGLP